MSGAAGRAAVVDRLCDFFVVATQTILYARAVYPRGTASLLPSANGYAILQWDMLRMPNANRVRHCV
jgi:hypothetical protein